MNDLLLIAILITVPPAHKGVAWDYGLVHNQVQVMHKYGLQVSYSAIMVPCHTRPIKPGWVVYHTSSMGQEVCYLTDVNIPVMVRHKNHWYPATFKTSKGHNE